MRAQVGGRSVAAQSAVDGSGCARQMLLEASTR